MFKAILGLIVFVLFVFGFLTIAGKFINTKPHKVPADKGSPGVGANIAAALRYVFIGMLLLFGAAFANNVFGPWF
jgi:hypothetical protein